MANVITSKTTIKELLEADKDRVIDALVKLNGNFSKLKNPLLRNLMARRVSIADACKMTGCTVQDFMDNMRALGFNIGEETVTAAADVAEEPKVKKASNFVELDVRPILAENRDPLKLILHTINSLQGFEGLKLINSFEPVPLIHLLSDKGFTHYAIRLDESTVVTYFNRIMPGSEVKIDSLEKDFAASIALFEETIGRFNPDDIKYLDVRNMEMPQPMITILETLAGMQSTGALYVYHKKRPVFLLPELEKRGFKYLFKDISANDVNMLIFRS
ncbi:MAG: DUF2249 domain-containing protein [Bacteroidetes bacterium]|nr:DUF2249 domain-containing protein [Bacteroidota bacterium]